MVRVKLHLNENDLNVIHWWVDASYGEYTELKVQKGATISIRKGCAMSALKEQKINMRRYTISEVVGVKEALP